MDNKIWYDKSPFCIVQEYLKVIKVNNKFWRESIKYYYYQLTDDQIIAGLKDKDYPNYLLLFCELLNSSCRVCYQQKTIRFHPLLDYFKICNDCRQTNDQYKIITLTNARKYGLTDDELDYLDYATFPNPYNSRGPPMTLYMEKDVRKLCSAKYGSWECFLTMNNSLKSIKKKKFNIQVDFVPERNRMKKLDTNDKIRMRNINRFYETYKDIIKENREERDKRRWMKRMIDRIERFIKSDSRKCLKFDKKNNKLDKKYYKVLKTFGSYGSRKSSSPSPRSYR